jgi:hypothetical protein
VPGTDDHGARHRYALESRTPNYCLRYRPAARQGEAVGTSTAHLGIRRILRPW